VGKTGSNPASPNPLTATVLVLLYRVFANHCVRVPENTRHSAACLNEWAPSAPVYLSTLIIRRQERVRKKDRAMAQKASHRLIRKVRRDRQEGQDYPVHLLHLAVGSNSISRAHTSPAPAGRSHQQQVSPSAATFAFDVASSEMAAGLTRTDFHSCKLPFSFSNIAVESKRWCMAIVAKQEEYCCGPRQGN
jgi:hypothetical protein